MGVFADCIIAVELGTSLSFKAKQELRKKITSNGGVISFIITKKCTYLVTSTPERAEDSYKCRQALRFGIPVLGVSFIDSCIEKGQRLDHDPFVVFGKTKAEEFGQGKIIASGKQPPQKQRLQPPSININNFKAWPFGDKNAPAFDEETYELAKSAVLLKTDSKDSDLFYVLEVHALDNHDEDNKYSHRFRVFTHSGSLQQKKGMDIGKKECRYTNSVSDALGVYAYLYKQQTGLPNNYIHSRAPPMRRIGSEKFQQMRSEIFFDDAEIKDEAVVGLIDHIWAEASGEIGSVLAVPVKSITLDQLEKAEGMLLQLKETIEKGKDIQRIGELAAEFYKLIPHNDAHKCLIRNKRVIATKQDFCQLIRDMLSVSEATDWSKRSDQSSKYRALRCDIDKLDEDGIEYCDVTDHLLSSQIGEKTIQVENIFALRRGVEDFSFTKALHNKKLLFHSSPVQNFVGILSRGLLLPKVVVDDYGGTRSDIGLLGGGLYFAEAASTSLKYSQASSSQGTRLMLVNEVALGECKDYYEHQPDLKAPPEGYHSTHGVRAQQGLQSAFKDDEYAIYSCNQQRMKYLVEFTLPEDEKHGLDVSQASDTGIDIDDDSEGHDSGIIDLDDVQHISDPLDKVQAGLVSSSDAPVPLTSVHIRAKLLDLAAQVVVLQEYCNENNSAIEAKYVFPLNEMAAVCGFEAFINGKHIVGEVKEKETAHREYKQAISEGHGAYLMDQDEETPDVFTVSVGNLPPHASVLIKITYVAELQVDGEKICFDLPGTVAPWKKDTALSQVTQTDLDTVKVKGQGEGDTTVQVAIDMPFDIRTLECPTHKVKVKRTACTAVVELAKNQSLGESFQLLIGLAEIHVPRMWVEEDPADLDNPACMLTFYPEFEAEGSPGFEVVFVLDMSNSMKGKQLIEAKKVLLLALHHLPQQCLFNVVVFGTGYEELFPCSQNKTMDSMKAAKKFVQDTQANMGNTEVYRPLHSLFLLSVEENLRNIFLVSDGHINNEQETLKAARTNSKHTRLFTFGVSTTANRHLLRSLAQAGAGAYEYFDSKTKSKWEGKVQSQMTRAAQPALTSLSVEWRQSDNLAPKPVQAPSHVTSLFSGSRQVIYGFVPSCSTMATLKADVAGYEISTVVSTSELNITKGKILHQLTARAVIREWEDGLLDQNRTQHEVLKMNRKNYIIQLSTKFSIVTQFTSFVAVEKRDKDEDLHQTTGPSIDQLVTKETVDILDYMGWEEEEEKESAVSPVEEVRHCMQRAEEEEKYQAVVQAKGYYEQAHAKAELTLPANHPLLLEVVNRYAEFVRDTLGDREEANGLVEQAVQNAIVEDVVQDTPTKESLAEYTLMLSKLKAFLSGEPTSPPYSSSSSISSSSSEYEEDYMMSDEECCLEMYDDMGSFQEYGDLRTEKLRATSPPPMLGMEAPPPPPMLEMGGPPPPPPPPPTNAYHTAKKKSLQIAPLTRSMTAMGGPPPPHTPMKARMRGAPAPAPMPVMAAYTPPHAPWHLPQGAFRREPRPQFARMARKSAPPPPPAQMLGMGAPPMPGMAAPPPPPAPPIRPQMAMMKPAREPQPLSAQMARMSAPPPPPAHMLELVAPPPPRSRADRAPARYAARKSQPLFFKTARKISPKPPPPPPAPERGMEAPATMARMSAPPIPQSAARKSQPIFFKTTRKISPPPPPPPPAPELGMEPPAMMARMSAHSPQRAMRSVAPKPTPLFSQMAKKSAPLPPPPKLAMEAPIQLPQSAPHRAMMSVAPKSSPLYYQLGSNSAPPPPPPPPPELGIEAQQGSSVLGVGGCVSAGPVFGAPAGSSFGAPAGFSFGAPAGSSFGAPAGSGFGAREGSVFGARGGSGLSAPAGSGFGAQAGSGFTMRSGSVFGGGYGFGAPAGSDVGEQSGSVFGAPPTFDLPPAPSAGVELSSGHFDLRFAPDLPQSQPQSAGKGHLSQVNKGGVSLRQSDDTPELTRVSNEAKIKADVEEIKMMMRDNIDKVLERSECLESLESKSASFKKMSTQRKIERATQDLQTADIIMESSMSSPPGLTEETGVSWRKSSVKEIERGKKKKKAQVQQPVSEAISEPVESRSRESHWRSRGFQAVVGKRAGLRSRALRAKADLECDDVEEDHDEEVEPFIQDEGEWDADLDLLGDAYGDEGEKEEEEEDDDMGYALSDGATSRQVSADDSEGYHSGRDTPLFSVVTGKPKIYNSLEVAGLMREQNKEHGYWDLESVSLQSTLAIDKRSLTEIFMDAGLKSLGKKAMQNILRLVDTLIVLARILEFAIGKQNILKVLHGISGKYLMDNLETLLECGQKELHVIVLHLGDDINKAVEYCQNVIKDHPLVYSTLQLGNSWENVVQKLLNF